MSGNRSKKQRMKENEEEYGGRNKIKRSEEDHRKGVQVGEEKE